MIVTGKSRIPWSWVVFITLPTFGSSMVEYCSHMPMTFLMKRFTDLPYLITFLGSINIIFSFAVAPFIAYHSDRIWTRFGRRKPFIVAGWMGLVVSMILMPMAPNLWTLALVIVMYQFFEDVAHTGPWMPLYYEVVPLPQRGRASAISTFISTSSKLLMNLALLGQFDQIYKTGSISWLSWLPNLTFNGAHITFWFAALVILVMTLLVAFGVRETKPALIESKDRYSIVAFVKNVFGNRQWTMIYILVFAQMAMNQGIAQMAALMMTEQFGYAKKTIGELDSANMIIQLAIAIPLAGILADKIDRIKMFQWGLALTTLHHFSYWGFIKFLAAEHIPSPMQIISFNIAHSFINVIANIGLLPLMFDFIPRNKMGTVFAGMTFVKGMIKVILVWGVGLFVTGYSWLFWTSKVVKGVKVNYDYSSGYLYTTTLGVIGFLVSVKFARLRREGKLIEYGRLELEEQKDKPAEQIA